jgi:alpha-tubulin suppressor-like RCC1 family protein
VGVNVVQVATGSAHTCVVTNAGFLRCWGSNGSGQLGYGHTQSVGDNETPAQAVTRTVAVAGVTRALGGDIAVGGNVAQVQLRQGQRDGEKTCVRLLGGAVRCWGSGAFGGLGYAHQSNIGDNETPAEAATLTARLDAQGNPILLGGNLALGGNATTLADGGDQCALRTDGQVVCWRGPGQVPTLVAF